MLTMSTTIHGTILHSAVASGATEVFEAVLGAARESLTPEKVSSCHSTCSYHGRRGACYVLLGGRMISLQAAAIQ